MKKWRINRPDPVKTAEFMNKCDLKSLTLDVLTALLIFLKAKNLVILFL